MRVTDEKVEAAETPMSDHIASFWRLLEKEHARILIEMRRDTSSMTYWDSSSFSDDVAKALVADRNAALAVEGTEAKPVAYQSRESLDGGETWSGWYPVDGEALDKCISPSRDEGLFRFEVRPLYTTPPAGIRDTDEQRAIGNGMAIAAGIVMKCWGDTVTAYDIDLVKPALRGQS